MLSVIKQLYMLMLPACLLSLSTAIPSLADEETGDNVRKCINARSLRTTEVVDDRNILFYLSGKTVYLNILPKECKGLSRERRFSYRTSGTSLCNFDTIRILSDRGGGLHEGKLCRLGYFHLTSKEAIAEARERGSETPRAKPPAGAEVEEIGTETEESED